MREILFRGKRTDNGEWVEGYYACIGETSVIFTGELDFSKWDIRVKVNVIIPETVGQYTGLTDKNGIKIFEGDVVLYFGERNLVEWNDSEATFFLSNEDNERCYFDDVDNNVMFIIGDIYDNPELLKNNNLEEHENG